MPAQLNCQTCDKPKCEYTTPSWIETSPEHLNLYCHKKGHPPREGRDDGERCDGSGTRAGQCTGPNGPFTYSFPCEGCPSCRNQEAAKEPLCPSCSKPYTYDPSRYQGGFFCENAGCPAYQGIPATDFSKIRACRDCGTAKDLGKLEDGEEWTRLAGSNDFLCGSCRKPDGAKDRTNPDRFKDSCQFPSSHSAADWAICRLPEHGVPAHGAAKCEGCGNRQTYDCEKCGAKNLCRVCPKGIHSNCPAPAEAPAGGGEAEELRKIVEAIVCDDHFDACLEMKDDYSCCRDRTMVDELMALLSRSEKAGEARAWGKAVDAFDNAMPPVNPTDIEEGTEQGWEEYQRHREGLRADLIRAAKDDGHQVG